MMHFSTTDCSLFFAKMSKFMTKYTLIGLLAVCATVLCFFSCAIFKHARNFYCHTFPPIKKARSSDATGFRTV